MTGLARLRQSGKLASLRTNTQGQQTEYGVGEATPHPQVLDGLTDETRGLELRRRQHARALALDVGSRRSHDDVEQLTALLVLVVGPVVPMAGVVPEAEDDVLDTEVGSSSQLRQTDPATLAVLPTVANVWRLVGLESLARVAESFDGHGLAELTLVDLLCADQSPPPIQPDGWWVDCRILIDLIYDNIAEGLVADIEPVISSTPVGVSEQPQLLGLHTDEQDPSVRPFHNPLAVRDDVLRCHLHVVPHGVGVETTGHGQIGPDLPGVVGVNTTIGIDHPNHLQLRYTD